jgi:hypothetical protein
VSLNPSWFGSREILGRPSQPFDWDVAGQSIFMIFILAIPYFFLVLILEYADDGGAGGFVGRGLRAIGHYWTCLMLKWYGIRTTSDDGDVAQYRALGDNETDDEDVAKERQYVMKNSEQLRHTAPVVLLNLWKVYPPSVGILGSLFMRVRRFVMSVLCFWSKSHVIDVDDDEEKTFAPKQAVRGVSTAINKGETYALLGANGTYEMP